jgi:hypothetical protein
VVDTGDVMVFLSDRFIITVRHGPAGALALVRGELQQQPALLAEGPWAVANGQVIRYGQAPRGEQSDVERPCQLSAELCALFRFVAEGGPGGGRLEATRGLATRPGTGWRAAGTGSSPPSGGGSGGARGWGWARRVGAGRVGAPPF